MRPVVRAAPWAASAWAAFFGFVHVYWAFGGSAGLPQGLVLAEHRALFLADMAAIPLCFAAAALARFAVRRTLTVRVRRVAAILLSTASTFFALHSAPSLVKLVGLIAEGRAGGLGERDRLALFVYEPFWFLGAVLFSLTAWRAWELSATTA